MYIISMYTSKVRICPFFFIFFSKINCDVAAVRCIVLFLCFFTIFVKHFFTEMQIKIHQVFMAEEFMMSHPRLDLLSVSFTVIIAEISWGIYGYYSQIIKENIYQCLQIFSLNKK